MQLSETTTITSDGQLTTTGETTAGSYIETFPDSTGTYNWYPFGQYPWYPELNKTAAAFNVASKLIEEKIIDKLTAKKFIELVNKISEII